MVKDVLILTKHKISLLTAFAALSGFIVNGGAVLSFEALILFVGTFLVSGFAGGLNQVIEVLQDSRMGRTYRRPLVKGVFSIPDSCLIIGFYALIGFLLLFFLNPKVAFLGILTVVIYNFFYTPLKQKTSLSIWVGALSGALPVLGGAISAAEAISYLAWMIFMVQFLWQIPHFYALSIKYKTDYETAGFKLTSNSSIYFSSVVISTIFTVVLGMELAFLSKNLLIWILLFNLSAGLSVSMFNLFISHSKEAGDYACKNSIVYLSGLLISAWFI